MGKPTYRNSLCGTLASIQLLLAVLLHSRPLVLKLHPHILLSSAQLRRASDILKAVALGATAVGIGRPFIYAYSAYGEEGVKKALQILHDEFEMNMRLLGANTLDDVIPSMLDARSLSNHSVSVPEDRLYGSNYESLRGPQIVKSKL